MKIGARAPRKSVANRGCIGLIVMFSLIFIVAFAKLVADAEHEQKLGKQASASPLVAVDSKLMPVLNVEIRFIDGDVDAEMISKVGRELEKLGRKIAVDRQMQSAKFMNVMVWDRVGRVMHMTIDVPKLLSSATRYEAPSATLATGRQLGFNELRGERAARDWCQGRRSDFCDQIP